MAFRKLATDHIVTGTLLAIVHRRFPERIPTVSEYAEKTGIASSTFWRAADWLWSLLPGLFRSRRPGPSVPHDEPEEPARDKRQEAQEELDELRLWLKDRSKTPKNRSYDGEAKKRIAEVAERIRSSKVMTYKKIAAEIGMDPRHLNRIRREVKEAGGEAPETKSRRPKKSERLHRKIQILIARIEASADSRRPYGATDIKRILEKNYQEHLQAYHGRPTISKDTVKKYMGTEPPQEEVREHPRGSYTYPEPFQVVALDTSHFKIFGFTYYWITVFDMGGRLNLITRTFLRENTEAVVSVIEEFLARFPGVQVAVLDRGTPYLNEEVKAILESHGRYRLVCPPETPTAKACIERHFGTVKSAIRQAVEAVFPQDPGWPHEQMAKALELAVAVFAALYHRIPQEGIDGKTPAERALVFDPVRACARQAALFEHALNAEPSDQYVRHIHRFFQFPWEEKKTVGALRQFSTRVLRRLLEEEKKILGPPFPDSIYDPLGYLAARAREIKNKLWSAFFAEEWRKADAEDQRQRQEQEIREQRENPEVHVDGMLRALVTSVRNRHGVSASISFMREVLGDLARTMRGFFTHEIERLKRSVSQLCENARVVTEVTKILDDIAADLRAA